MNDLCRIIEQINFEKKEKMALATIIRIDGSSYRKVGAKMLFWDDGRRVGTISAGCLEDDLESHSLNVIKNHCCKIVTYDLKDEDDFTWGVGCNGKIEVLIEPISFNQNLIQLRNYLFSGRKVISIKLLKNDTPPLTYLYSNDGKRFESEIGVKNQPEFSAAVLEFIKSNQKLKIVTLQDEDYLFEINDPKCYLYIFGAGIDAEPLVRLASSLDFAVTVIDPRESRCNRDFFPTAKTLIIEHPDSFFKHHKLHNSSFVVIMNHHFNRDKQILEKLSIESPAYIGILGSRKRTERLLSHINDPIKDKIHYPIGLKILAEGPNEISVSIIAELIQIRHQLMDADYL